MALYVNVGLLVSGDGPRGPPVRRVVRARAQHPQRTVRIYYLDKNTVKQRNTKPHVLVSFERGLPHITVVHRFEELTSVAMVLQEPVGEAGSLTPGRARPRRLHDPTGTSSIYIIYTYIQYIIYVLYV